MRLCRASWSNDWTGVCIRSTVKKAARLAVNVANISTTKSQYAATIVRPDNAFGASPPPCGVNDVRANQKLSFNENSLQSVFYLFIISWN